MKGGGSDPFGVSCISFFYRQEFALMYSNSGIIIVPAVDHALVTADATLFFLTGNLTANDVVYSSEW